MPNQVSYTRASLAIQNFIDTKNQYEFIPNMANHSGFTASVTTDKFIGNSGLDLIGPAGLASAQYVGQQSYYKGK